MSLKKELKDVVPKDLMKYIPSSYDIIGNVIIINIHEKLKKYYDLIGSTLLKIHKNVKSVYRIKGRTCGIHRIRPLELIAGVELDHTVHVEYGVKFHVDFKRVYINPSLGYEHHRISTLTRDGERVLDMFSGIGGFTLHIASKRVAHIVAVDINIHAIRSLVKSLELNRIKGYVDPIVSDSKHLCETLGYKFDRVIMNYPEGSHMFIKTLCSTLKSEGGYVHYYRFSDLMHKPVFELILGVKTYGRRVVKIHNVRRVLKATPSRSLYAVDAYIL